MNTAVVVIVVVLVIAAGWGLRRLYLPDASCRWCKGGGKRWGSTRKRSGPCFFCGGTGRRKSRKKARS